MRFGKVAVIGMGLIGGSIGKALIKRKLANEVVGVFRRQSSLDRAVKEGAISTGYLNSLDEALAGAEVVFIATPVPTIKTVLKNIAASVRGKKILVTDVGSVKKEISDYALNFKKEFSFVGGHPLAGSEESGVEHSNAGIFEKAPCILTRDPLTCEDDLRKIQALWQAMGAVVSVMTPEEHDAIVSFTSHLPHVVAYALAGSQKKEDLKYTSTGFKDTTRIAASDPRLWSDIFMDNRGNVLSALAKFRETLSGIEDDIRNGRQEI
ncbi:MAG: prephenate dehydrogenase/arogenate dehydrogenase family protein [Candidatus Omnitrophota bacterium]